MDAEARAIYWRHTAAWRRIPVSSNQRDPRGSPRELAVLESTPWLFRQQVRAKMPASEEPPGPVSSHRCAFRSQNIGRSQNVALDAEPAGKPRAVWLRASKSGSSSPRLLVLTHTHMHNSKSKKNRSNKSDDKHGNTNIII